MMGSIAFRVKDSESLGNNRWRTKAIRVPVWEHRFRPPPYRPEGEAQPTVATPTITPNLLLLHGNLLAVRPFQTAGRFPFG